MDYKRKLLNILKSCYRVNGNEDIFIWGAGNTTELNWSCICEEQLIPWAFIDNFRTSCRRNNDGI